MAFSTQPIPKDAPLPPGQDFAWLRQRGLHLLEQLSGRVWTDYNLHDPGVTLLEALCYALTDLSHRASQPVPTLLATAPGAPAPASLLVPPHLAFANHPATLADYKKLVLDRFHTQVKNAWLSPLRAPGHYRLELEPLPPLAGPPAPASAKELAAQVLAFLNCHRQLGELFVHARVLRPQPLAVGLHLELNPAPGQAPEEVMAAILLRIAHYLDPYLQAPTLVRLLAKPTAVEDIFAGPVARHRLLQESSFAPLRQRVHAARLVKLVRQVPGLHYLAGLELRGPGHEAPVATVVRRAHRVLTLDLEASLTQLTPTRQRRPLAFDPERVRRSFYHQLHQDNLSVQNALRPDQLHLPDPLANATYQALGRYDSVQHLLPALYGTGEGGPPPGSTGRQQAAAMQLKGYLLLLEQVLADFCAQLENTASFFSPSAQPTTYYSGSLYEVPHVAPLLPKTDVSPAETWGYDAAAAGRWHAYQQQAHNPYQRALHQLAESPDDWQRRRQRFLTHLLARFGYDVAPHPAAPPGGLPAELATIGTCERLLLHLQAATYHRAAARLPPLEPAPSGVISTRAESGLEFFLYLLTGLESLPRKWARGQALATLEAWVQLPGAPPAEGVRLVVRGRPLVFAELVAVVRTQLAASTLEAVSTTAARVRPQGPAASQEMELHLVLQEEIEVDLSIKEQETPPEEPVPFSDALVNRLLGHLHGLDAELARFSLLDHLVLKPQSLLTKKALKTNQEEHNFYHCQATLLLPGYARQFHYDHHSPASQHRTAASHRSAVEALARQYAPAHLLLHVLWLDYEAMRHWEDLYAALAAASNLLNATGHPDEAALEAAQAQALHFLRERLPATPAS